MKKLNILATTDDGYLSRNFEILCSNLSAQGHNVYRVAPLQNKSCISAALESPATGKFNFTVKDDKFLVVDATPSDCVHFAKAYFKDTKFDLCVSGINFGENTGIHSLHSGTVMAAITASSYGIPSIAVSSAHTTNDVSFDKAYEDSIFSILSKLIKVLLKLSKPLYFKDDKNAVVLNFNIPAAIYKNPIACISSTTSYKMSISSISEGDSGSVAQVSSELQPAMYGDSTLLSLGHPTITILSQRLDVAGIPQNFTNALLETSILLDTQNDTTYGQCKSPISLYISSIRN